MEKFITLEDLKEEILKGESFVKSKEAIDRENPITWICKIKGPLIAALKIAMWFVGRREKEIIQALIDWINTICP